MQWSLSGGVVCPHAGLYPAWSGAQYILECAVMNTFWMDLSRYLFPSMYSSQRFFKIEVTTQEIRAIGLKLAGCEGSFSAASFPINLMAASFQSFGITD